MSDTQPANQMPDSRYDGQTNTHPRRWPGVLARQQGRTLKIGHKGCDAVVAGNALESLSCAAELGVDAVEFDVIEAAGELRLAHDLGALKARPDAPTLADALALFSQPEMAHLGLHVDCKIVGTEAAIIEQLRDYDLVARSMLSSNELQTMHKVRDLEPNLWLSYTAPRAKRDYLAIKPLRPLLKAAIAGARRTIQGRLVQMLSAGQIDAVTAHFSLVDPAFAKAVLAVGELHVWTVDDQLLASELQQMGVSGVISNDPRLLVW